MQAESGPAYFIRPEIPQDIIPNVIFNPSIDDAVSNVVSRTDYLPVLARALVDEERYRLKMPGERPETVEFISGYSCLHAHDKELGDVRADVALVTDLTGSQYIDKTKEIFYENIVNPVGKLLDNAERENREVSDEDLLSVSIGREPGDTRTVVDGLEELLNYQYWLEEDPRALKGRQVGDMLDSTVDERIRQRIEKEWKVDGKWDRSKVADKILEYSRKQGGRNHGKWIASLPKESRQRIIGDIETHTKSLIEKLDSLRTERKTRVIMVPGNWDGIESMEQIAGGDGSPDNRIDKIFDTLSYLREKQFEVFDSLRAVETENTVIISADFFWLKYYQIQPQEDESGKRQGELIQDVYQTVEKGRKEGKIIIFYPHGSAEPDALDASSSRKPVSRDNRKVAEAIRDLMGKFRPNQVFANHYHMEMINSKGEIVPLGSHHLVYNYGLDGQPVLINNSPELDQPDGQLTVESYVPFSPVPTHGEIIIDKNRQGILFHGNPPGFLPARIVRNKN
ncbi:hypothetical protein HY407_04220 [Candidatus Gottesmanbacteria bacterium]|nr:hypothetical protein [Candidatus Gottesmanbacteria bacterium]